MIKSIIFLLFASLAGCGQGTFQDAGVYDETGVVIEDPRIGEDFEAFFAQVEAMTEMKGDIDSMILQLMPGNFDCVFYNGRCAGEFIAHNMIKINKNLRNGIVMCEEIVHYLLYFTTGNADAGHVSPFFVECKSKTLLR